MHKEGKSYYRRLARIFVSWLTVMLMIIFTGVAATNAYLVRELSDILPLGLRNTAGLASSEDGREVDRVTAGVGDVEFELEAKLQERKFKWLSCVCSLFFIQIMSRVYKRLALWLTDWENHRTQTAWDDSLVIKNFVRHPLRSSPKID